MKMEIILPPYMTQAEQFAAARFFETIATEYAQRLIYRIPKSIIIQEANHIAIESGHLVHSLLEGTPDEITNHAAKLAMLALNAHLNGDGLLNGFRKAQKLPPGGIMPVTDNV